MVSSSSPKSGSWRRLALRIPGGVRLPPAQLILNNAADKNSVARVNHVVLHMQVLAGRPQGRQGVLDPQLLQEL